MKFLSQQKIQPDWWTKTLAGGLLGLSFSFACATLITIWGFEYVGRENAPQLGMWSIPWIWLPLFFISYIIPKGWQSMVTFVLLNVVTYSLLFWLRG